MNRRMYGLTLFLLAGLLLLSVSLVALAQDGAVNAPSADYDISWWTVDGGGASFSEGGGYALQSTIGQPDTKVLEGGGYALSGGFWSWELEPPLGPAGYNTYLPLVTRNF